MSFQFTKMQGLGNDFVVIDATTQHILFTAAFIQKIADRHTGVGCDQVLVLTKATDPRADFGYRIFNADGNEVYQCGNGARCMGLFIQTHNLSQKKQICLQTRHDFINVVCCENGEVAVDLAIPNFENAAVPFIAAESPDNWKGSVVSVGNPHCVIRVDAISMEEVSRVGAALNQSPAFPEGVNVGFVRCLSRTKIELCVYERGVGLTRACGSGACAAVAVGVHEGWLESTVVVHQAGGVLTVTWPLSTRAIQLRGPAENVYSGQCEWSVGQAHGTPRAARGYHTE